MLDTIQASYFGPEPASTSGSCSHSLNLHRFAGSSPLVGDRGERHWVTQDYAALGIHLGYLALVIERRICQL